MAGITQCDEMAGKMPLSTEEIYLGSNARRSVVSYQL